MAKITRRQRSSRVPVAPATKTALQKRRQLAVTRGGVTIVLVIVVIGLIWATVQWLLSAYWASVAVRQQVSYGEFLVTVPAQGLVLRDENLRVAPDGGVVTLHVYEGDSITAGQHIASLDNALSTQAILNQIADLEKRLETYDVTDAATVQALDQRILQDAQTLQQKMTQLRYAVQSYDREAINKLEQEIKQLNGVRLEKVSNRLQMPDDPLTIQNKLDSLRQQLEQTGDEVYAYDDGIISFWIDGAEGSYPLSSFSRITADAILTPPIAVDVSKNNEAKAGAALFKVVDPGPWRWTGLITKDSWQQREDGLVHFTYSSTSETGEIQQGRLISWLVYSLVDEERGTKMITVEFPQMIPAALKQRGLQLEYIMRESEGLVLQKSNLLKRNDQTGVLVVEEGTVRFVEVTISDNDGERVLISNLTGTKEIITNPSAQMIGLKLK